MLAQSFTPKKQSVTRAALIAITAGLSLGASVAHAAIVDSGAINVVVPNNLDGIYLNILTNASGTSGGTTAGWDINLYLTGAGLTFFWPAAPANSHGGVASAAPVYLPQAVGSVISAASTFSVASGGSGDAPFVNFRVTGSNNLGFRFFNEATSAINYGFMTIESTSPTGFPASIRRIVYGNAGEAVTVTPLGGGATPPQFGFTPAPGATVAATGGTTVGSTGNLSITPSIATAGTGTGTPATTTLTCTAPTAPFAGFAQTLTAVGAATAVTGGPLAGTCTLGSAVATQTLTCAENRGGTPTTRTWTLSCPAGSVPPAPTVAVNATSTWSLIALMLALFGFAAVAVRRQS
jgi:hypothetical protein